MTQAFTDDQIIAAFPAAPKSLRIRDLARKLGLPTEARGELAERVRQLVRLGKVTHHPGNRFTIAEHDGEVTGTLTLNPRGFGFVDLDGAGDDVYIPARSVGAALHRDRVRLRQHLGPRGPEGVITAVIERGLRTFVATVRQQRRGAILTAHDPRLPEFIQVEGPADFADGTLVAAEFVLYPGDVGGPSGRIIRPLEQDGEAAQETDLIIYDLGLPIEFPEAVEAQAKGYEKAVTEGELKTRHDLRSRPLITIDPESAKDFDDAVHVVANDEGGWTITVAIADVAHFVTEGTPLDDEAWQRGTSVYLPDRVLPMLPHHLSSDLCSLRPHEERLAMVAEMVLYRDGEIGAYQLYEAVIRSHGRFTYDRAARMLGVRSPDDRPQADNDPEMEALRPVLEGLRDATRARRRWRKRRGYLNLDLPEPRIVLDEQGEVDDVAIYQRHEAHMMIEEAMLMANEVVAADFVERGQPAMFRIHPRPSEDALTWFKGQAELFGVPLRIKGKVTPGQLTKYLKSLDDHPRRRILHQLLLRSMSKAVYEADPALHFGLGTETYLHFTSPIRRYPDLVVHRLIKDRLHGRDPVDAETLEGSSAHCSRRERVAIDAERTVQDLYKAMYVSRHVGEVFEGTIIGVQNFGLFVELVGHYVEGLVPIDRIGSDRYEVDLEQGMVKGRRSGTVHRLGDAVQVRVAQVDIRRRRVDFDLVDFV
ncbi:MAG: ribonuclease R [Bradymonadia bacterium]